MNLNILPTNKPIYGGLLQMITTGKQDIFLTTNPEITFFKKVFKKYSNFSLELREIITEQPIEYNTNISFKLNNGDLIHRCYLEIELPLLYFDDSYITNSNYIENKKILLNNYKSNLLLWKNKFNNLKEYANIELQLYIKLIKLFDTNNITNSLLINIVKKFNYINQDIKNNYINNIDSKLIKLIDISDYILNINYLIDNTNILNIKKDLDDMYNKIIYYLKYYNYFILKYNKLIDNISNKNIINYSYAEYLGHNFFKKFSINIGGIEIDSYDSTYLHINQLHKIKPDALNNYLDMIGHTPELFDFNSNSKGDRKILVPLIFWFNKNAGSSLPLIALPYADIIIDIQINSLNKIITFENYDDMYNKLLIIEIDNNNPNSIIYNNKLIYNKNDCIIKNYSIVYNCIYINKELLKYIFPNLIDEELIYILNKYGSKDNNINLKYPYLICNDNIDKYYINIYQWTNFMTNIKNLSFYNKIYTYYPYIDYNVYYATIKPPNIKLITENIYLDDIEREKFANSKLEYIIESVKTDIYYFPIINSYNCDLSFTKLCKELIWYIQPQIYYNCFNNNGKNKDLLFDITNLSNNYFIENQQIYLNNFEILLFTNSKSDDYYNYLLSYKYLNNILPTGIYYHSFCLYPEDTQPSGTVNLKYIKGKNYSININNNFINDYNDILELIDSEENKRNFMLKFISKNYELLIIHKSQANFI
jgi:hypothetical protein